MQTRNMKTTIKKEIISDPKLIAFCGLYCGACRTYLSGKCPGCKDNTKATWCKTRTCCIENKFQSCSDCNISDFKACKKCINFMSTMFGYIFNSDRSACLNRIKAIGYDAYAAEMTTSKRQTIRRK